MGQSPEIARALRDIAAGFGRLASALDPPAAPAAVASRHTIDFVTRQAIRENAEPWLSKKQAAAHLAVTTRCIVNWQRDRGLPHHPCGGINLYKRSELDRWVAHPNASVEGSQE
jgi:hypothetical protein